MVNRPPSDADKRAVKRERRRLAQREYRRRFDDGEIMVAVEIDGIDGAVVDMLIGNDWLTKAESHDRKKIAKAIARNAGGSGDAVIILLKLAV
jgi:hypothetical protein